MRVLTVRQPWAWAIVNADKDVENRPRNIAGSYRGPVAIHAGKGWAREGELDQRVLSAWRVFRNDAPFPNVVGVLNKNALHLDFGAIIGVADLVGVHESSANGCGTGEGFGTVVPQCSEWAQPWSHHLVLANPRPLRKAIPYLGALGLRTLDPAVEALITEQLR